MPKISQYTAVTAPANTDELVVNQGGVTKKVTLSTLKSAGGFAPYAKNNLSGAGVPGSGDDASAGYAAGSIWIDVTASPMEAYHCADATPGAAVWLKTTLTIDELGSGALRAIDAPTAENDMLFGSPSPFGAWVKKTLVQTKAILGLGGSVPAPAAENDVIMAAGSPLDWVRKTMAQLRTLIGLEDATTKILVGGGTGNPPVWTEATGSGAPVRATSPTLVTPALGTPRSGEMSNCSDLSETENIVEHIQYPIPTTGYMLKAAADGSPAKATNTDTEVADAVTKKHAQNTDTGTTATSFKINTGGNEADLQTTGLTADRDYQLPDIDTMLAGSVLTAQNTFEIIAYA